MQWMSPYPLSHPCACPQFPIPSPTHLRPASLDSVTLTMDRTSCEPLNLRAGAWETVTEIRYLTLGPIPPR